MWLATQSSDPMTISLEGACVRVSADSEVFCIATCASAGAASQLNLEPVTFVGLTVRQQADAPRLLLGLLQRVDIENFYAPNKPCPLYGLPAADSASEGPRIRYNSRCAITQERELCARLAVASGAPSITPGLRTTWKWCSSRCKSSRPARTPVEYAVTGDSTSG